MTEGSADPLKYFVREQVRSTTSSVLFLILNSDTYTSLKYNQINFFN